MIPSRLGTAAAILWFTICFAFQDEDVHYFTYRDINRTTVSLLLAKSLEDLVDNDSPRNVLKFKVSCDYDDGEDTVSKKIIINFSVMAHLKHYVTFLKLLCFRNGSLRVGNYLKKKTNFICFVNDHQEEMCLIPLLWVFLIWLEEIKKYTFWTFCCTALVLRMSVKFQYYTLRSLDILSLSQKNISFSSPLVIKIITSLLNTLCRLLPRKISLIFYTVISFSICTVEYNYLMLK